MQELFQTKTKIIINSAILIFILAIVAVIFLSNPKPIILGLVFGFLIGVLMFQQMYLAISKAVLLPPEKAPAFMGVRYGIRFLIYGGVLYISLLNPNLSILGTFLGLISIKISIVVLGTLGKLK